MLANLDKPKVFWWSILIFIFTIPLDQGLSVKLLIVALALSFILVRFQYNFFDLLARSWDGFLYVLVLLIGLTYSEDVSTGWKEIETSLSFLVLPLIFIKIPNLDSRRFNAMLYSFIGGLIVACLIYIFHASWLYFKNEDSRAFFSGHLTEVIWNSHPTYLAYYLIFSITVGLTQLYYGEPKIARTFFMLILFFLFVMLILTSGKTAFISMLLILAFFILKFLLEPKKTTNKSLTFGAACLFLLIMFAADSAEDRKPVEYYGSDSWERSMLWESAIRATPNLFFGVGTGDYGKVLNEYYESHGLAKFATESYNSHNQFIQVLFSNGVFGIIALLLLLGRPLYLSVKNQNVLGTLTSFPFLIYGMTEVFLGRYQGVVFFALLHQIFVALYQGHKSGISLKHV